MKKKQEKENYDNLKGLIETQQSHIDTLCRIISVLNKSFKLIKLTAYEKVDNEEIKKEIIEQCNENIVFIEQILKEEN